MIYSIYAAIAPDSPETFVHELTRRTPLRLRFVPDNVYYPYQGEAPESNVGYRLSQVYGSNDIFLFMTDYDYEFEIEVVSNDVEKISGQGRAFAQRLFATMKAMNRYHLLLLQDYGAPLDEYLPG